MIARLSGKLAETTSDSAVIDVGGVGYIVQASARTLDALGPIGGDVLILTELQVREDSWTLFIANELQGKLGVLAIGGAAPVPRAGAAADALSALANLGFKPADASAAVNAAQHELGADASLDALVRLALKKAAR